MLFIGWRGWCLVQARILVVKGIRIRFSEEVLRTNCVPTTVERD